MPPSESEFRLVNLPQGYRVGRFAALEAMPWVAHVVTTRHGPDVSPLKESDATPLAAVQRILQADAVAYAHHVHGTDIVEATGPGWAGLADGLVTRRAGLAVVVFSADCVTILAADPVARAVGALHSGWRGTVARAAGHPVRALADHCGSNPADLVACVGPSIGPCCFYANQEMIDLARQGFGHDAEQFLRPKGESTSFDLQMANALDLTAAGVKPNNIHQAGVCTYCRTEEFFSYQKDLGPGRFCSGIALMAGTPRQSTKDAVGGKAQ
jgi:hypothetical protein